MKKYTLFRKDHLWLHILFWIYAVLLVWLVLFKMDFFVPNRPRAINWIPFYYQFKQHTAYMEGAANLLAFVPLGLYLKMAGVFAKKIILGGAAVSLAFEVIQFAFAMGVSDITDLITNTLGTACGVGGYLLLRKCSKNPAKLDKGLNIAASVLTGLAVVFFIWSLVAFVLYFD